MTDRLAFWGSRLLARRAIRRRRGHRAAHLDLTPDAPPTGGRGSQSSSGVNPRPSDQPRIGKSADRTDQPVRPDPVSEPTSNDRSDGPDAESVGASLASGAAAGRGGPYDPSWYYQLPAQYRFRPASYRTVIDRVREAARLQIGVVS